MSLGFPLDPHPNAPLPNVKVAPMSYENMNETQATPAEDIVEAFFDKMDRAKELKQAVHDKPEVQAKLQAVKNAELALFNAQASLGAAVSLDERTEQAEELEEEVGLLRDRILESWDGWFDSQTPPGLGIQRRTRKGIRVVDPYLAVEEFEKKGMLQAATDEKKLAAAFKVKFVRDLLDGDVSILGIDPEDSYSLADVRAKGGGA